MMKQSICESALAVPFSDTQPRACVTDFSVGSICTVTAVTQEHMEVGMSLHITVREGAEVYLCICT